MMLNNRTKLIEFHEGRKARKYRDSEGYWTIGVGHLIDPRKGGGLPKFIADELKARGIYIWKDEPMPNDLIDKLRDYDIEDHAEILRVLQPWVADLDPVRQAVMDDMVFNLGPEPFDHDGFKDWPIFISQVKHGEYKAAAENMSKTLWAKQVKSRAVRLSGMMVTGQWPVV
jgi:lysozyme